MEKVAPPTLSRTTTRSPGIQGVVACAAVPTGARTALKKTFAPSTLRVSVPWPQSVPERLTLSEVETGRVEVGAAAAASEESYSSMKTAAEAAVRGAAPSPTRSTSRLFMLKAGAAAAGVGTEPVEAVDEGVGELLGVPEGVGEFEGEAEAGAETEAAGEFEAVAEGAMGTLEAEAEGAVSGAIGATKRPRKAEFAGAE